MSTAEYPESQSDSSADHADRRRGRSLADAPQLSPATADSMKAQVSQGRATETGGYAAAVRSGRTRLRWSGF